MSGKVVFRPKGQIDITVTRQVATYVYGNFRVIIPEDSQQVKDDRYENGFVYRPDDRPTGRFDLGFVRSDVTIDLNSQQSDVEAVVDAAQLRMEGDVFVEQDVSGPGVGHAKLGEDVNVGDMVDLEVGGKLLELPVTSADVTEVYPFVEYHLGGHMLQDAVARRSRVDQILAAIDAERRRAAKEKKALEEQAARDRQQWRAIGDTTSQVKAVANRSWSLGQDLAASNNTIANWSKAWRLLWTELEAVENVSMALREVMFEVVRALNAVDSGKAQAAVKAFNDRSSNHLASNYISYKQQLWWNQMNGRVVGEINTSKYNG